MLLEVCISVRFVFERYAFRAEVCVECDQAYGPAYLKNTVFSSAVFHYVIWNLLRQVNI